MGKKRLESIFKTKKDRLSLYHTAGYPSLESMVEVVKSMDESGIDFVELGMPYSDPLADGPTIQESSNIAINNGISLEIYFDQVSQTRDLTSMPLLFMGYFNQVLRYGIDRFLAKCVEVGIDGLILPDMPPDIYENRYMQVFKQYDLAMIFLVTPTCSDERIRKIDDLSSGFVYVVSSSSTTGKTKGFDEDQLNYFKRIRDLKLKNPTIVGFGISSHQSFKQVNEYMDGAIIGSTYIKSIADGDVDMHTKAFIQRILNE